ncbi:MAG: hypothetical protein E7612_00075 [Ruminococcaceae bacterium]|nr:hypothetical protein [Oscillospiraceae bacterium]
MNIKKALNKSISMLLCIAMIVPMLYFLPMAVSADTSGAESTFSEESTTQTTYLDGVYYQISKHVVYSGNNSYQFNVDITTSLSDVNTPVRRTSSKNGFFTVEIDGYYLLELWGGEGSDGGDSVYAFGSVVNPGGHGGAAGYVYAKVYLKKGQTLAYSIGTNGAPTVREDTGGGVNGNGGEHGEGGSYTIGGGGGFSALYLFDDGEFNPSWFSAAGALNIPNTARVSRYVMIAAGGGGGGAGNGLGQYYGSSYADGGTGGNINNGPSLTLSGDSYAVEGYIFSGGNGKSSGTSTKYTGKGGTNVPGRSPSTSGGKFTAQPSPNDWSGSYNIEVSFGAGGTSNFRGGGGGAGYCGGSGGIMYSQLIAGDVGGGGGGSSFLAMSFLGSEPLYANALDADTKALLLGESNCPSSVGGAFSCTYLGTGNGSSLLDTTYLTSALVEGEFSKYFDVLSCTSVDAEGNENGVLSYDESTGKFTVASANIDASTAAGGGTLLSLSFVLKAKEDFAGGNKVPLLNALSATVAKVEGEPKVITSDACADTDEVNVPLRFKIDTNSIMTSLKSEGSTVSFPIKDLYNADYAGIIEAIKNGDPLGWQYDFVTSLSDYSVYEDKNGASGSPVITENTPELTETTYYSVVLTATADESLGYAKVGPKNVGEQTFMGIACIAIVSSDIFAWEYSITANKYLSHDGTSYIFEERVQQSTESTFSDSNYYTNSTANSYTESTFTATQEGYYLLQAWGADGGAGGTAYAGARLWNISSIQKVSAAGGAKGLGATVYGFVYLKAGDTLTMSIGKAGTDGSSHSNGVGYTSGASNSTTYNAYGWGGTGGGYCAFSLTRSGEETATPILIAAGGSGGGGGAAGATATGSYSDVSSGKNGRSPGDKLTSTNYRGSLSSYAGGNGSRGSGSISGTLQIPNVSGGSAGSIAENYYDPYVINQGLNDGETIYIQRLADTLVQENAVIAEDSMGNAAAQITYICTPLTTETLNKFPSVYTSGAFSEYFDINQNDDGTAAIEMEFDGITPDSKTVETADGATTVTYYTGDIVMATFSYVLTPNADGTLSFDISNTLYYPTFEISELTDNGYIANSGFSLKFSLSPKEGFLGGNDVPVLPESDTEFSCIKISQNEYEGYLSADPSVDYANIEIDYDLASDFTVKNSSVVLGDPDTTNDTVMLSELYTLSTDLSALEEWQTRFVTLVPPADRVIAPAQTETVSFEASIVPKTKTPEKALVIGATDGLTVNLAAVVYVNYYVTYTMTNMEHSGNLLALCNTEFKTTLSASDGYLLPPISDDEKVYIGLRIDGEDVTVTEAIYNAATGEITIPAELVTAPIEIIAVAKEKEYTIHFIYYLDGDEEGVEYTESYVADEEINYEWFDSLNSTIAPKTGYFFHWDWDTDDGNQPETMPAHDVWAIGAYQKQTYLLLINYVDSNGNELAPSHSEQVEFEAEYRVSSPEVDEYIPTSADRGGESIDPFVVTGTMGAGDVTVTVTYSYAKNRLVILYLNEKDEELAVRVDETLTENAYYDSPTPSIDGYTPYGEYAERVSGTMNGTESVFIKVYYTPNQYEVIFEYTYGDTEYLGPKLDGIDLDYDFSDAYMDIGEGFFVEYDNIYSYNAKTGEYGLPTPVVLGFEFAGWYFDSALTEEVAEEATVRVLDAVTLYAKWIPQEFKVTVIYSFEYENGDFLPDYNMLAEGTLYMESGGYYYQQKSYYAGHTYSFILGSITGYTAYSDYGFVNPPTAITELAGKMPASNLMFYVTYEINTYEIIFADLLGENITYPTHTAVDRGGFDTHWETVYAKHGTIPEYTAAEPAHLYDPEAPDARNESYSYTFTHWKNSSSNATYAMGDTLEVAVADVYYYACYDARENIALIQVNGVIQSYHASLQEAFDTALTEYNVNNSGDAPHVKLRRNADVESTTVNLVETDGGRTVSSINDGSSFVYFDLNGHTLYSNNNVLKINQWFTLYDSVGGGAIIAEATGDVCAIEHQASTLYLGQSSSSNAFSVSASSQNGTAIAVSSSSQIVNYCAPIEARAKNGDAIGIEQTYDVTSTYVTVYVTVTAISESGCAYGVRSTSHTSLSGAASISASSTDGDSYGVYCTRNVYLSTESKVDSSSVNKNAIAICSGGATSATTANASLQPTITASSQNGDATAIDAYGINNLYANLYANAPNGKAVGLDASATSYYYVGASGYGYTVTAIGKKAIAIDYSYSFYLYATAVAIGEEAAIGISNLNYTVYLGLDSLVSAATESGTSYGIKNADVVANGVSGVGVTAEATDGSAYALYDVSTNNSTAAISCTATATTGNAYGIAFVNVSGLVCNDTLTVSAAVTDGGSAYGILSSNAAEFGGTATAEGKFAFGAYATGKTLVLPSTAAISAVSADADGAAYGAYTAEGGEILAKAGSSVTASAENTAYGIYNNGLMTELAAGVNATAKNNAYGIYNAGSLASTAAGLAVTCESSEADSYGIYSVLGSVGGNSLAESIRYGVILATAETEGKNGYAFYADGGYIYIRGSELYYKGSSDATAKYGDGVVICKGYTETLLPADHATYPSYYTLAAIEFTITFIQVDLDGVEAADGRTVVPYTPDTTSVEEPAFIYTFTGYMTIWQYYDFSAPESGTNKDVYCIYDPNTYTITFITNGGSAVESISQKYTYAITAPEAPTLYGNTFAGWYSDSSLTVEFVFDTMPAYDLTLYAKYTPNNYTITFVTNGGTAVSPITAPYGSYVTLPKPTRPGYSFSSWYKDEALTQYFGSGSVTMPAEDITVYAKWSVSLSVVVLGEPKEYTVRLNLMFDIDGDGVNEYEDMHLAGGQLTYLDVSDLTMLPYLPASDSPDGKAYLLLGWFSSPVPSADTVIDLSSGVGSWGIKAVNGIVNVYAGWKELPHETMSFGMMEESNYTNGDYTAYNIYYENLGSLGIPSIKEAHDGSAGYLGLVPISPTMHSGISDENGYFYSIVKAPIDVTVDYYFSNFALTEDFVAEEFEIYVNISLYHTDATVTTLFDSKLDAILPVDLNDPNIFNHLTIEASEGDILVVRVNRPADAPAPSTDALPTFYSIAVVPDIEFTFEQQMDLAMIHNAMDFFLYTADMGSVALDPAPIDGFVGWTWKENGEYNGTVLTHMSTAMYDYPSAWSSMDGTPVLILYPLTEAGVPIDWMGMIVPDRHFNPTAFDNVATTTVTVRPNGSATFAFVAMSEIPADYTGEIKFDAGLPKGVTVTLTDFSGDYPVFYYYVVDDSNAGIKSISLSEFTVMGGEEKFSGVGYAMVFTVSYSGVEHTIAFETVNLYVNGRDTETSLFYTLAATREDEIGSAELEYDDDLEGVIPIPALTNRGYESTDKVVMAIRLTDLDGNILPMPTTMAFTTVGATIVTYSDFAFVEVGIVAYFTSSQTVTGIVDLDALRYSGFDGYITYEIIVLPSEADVSAASFAGTQYSVDSRLRFRLTVSDPPPITLDSVKGETKAGGVIELDVSVGDAVVESEISLYSYQIFGSSLNKTDASATLLSDFTVDENGLAVRTDGESLTSGKLTLNVSDDAESGVYYLVFYYGEQYEVFVLTVS